VLAVANVRSRLAALRSVCSAAVMRFNLRASDTAKVPQEEHLASYDFLFGFHDLEMRLYSTRTHTFDIYTNFHISSKFESNFEVSLDHQQCSGDRFTSRDSFMTIEKWKCELTPTKFCLPPDSWIVWVISKGACVTSI
jgi:hypothetical protein